MTLMIGSHFPNSPFGDHRLHSLVVFPRRFGEVETFDDIHVASLGMRVRECHVAQEL